MVVPKVLASSQTQEVFQHQHVKIPRIYATFGEFVAPCKYINDNLLVTYSPPRPNDGDLTVFRVENKEDPESEGKEVYGLAVRVTFDGGKTFYPKMQNHAAESGDWPSRSVSGLRESQRAGRSEEPSRDNEIEEAEDEKPIGWLTRNVFFFDRASSLARLSQSSEFSAYVGIAFDKVRFDEVK